LQNKKLCSSGGKGGKGDMRERITQKAERRTRNRQPAHGPSITSCVLWVPLASVRRLPLPYFHLSLRPLRLPGRATAPAVARCVEGCAVRCLPFHPMLGPSSATSALKPPGNSGDRHFRRQAFPAFCFRRSFRIPHSAFRVLRLNAPPILQPVPTLRDSPCRFNGRLEA